MIPTLSMLWMQSENNQNIWVEKPLAISIKELEKIREVFLSKKK